MYFDQEDSDMESDTQDDEEEYMEDDLTNIPHESDENNDLEKDIYSDEHVWDARTQKFRFRSEVWCSFEDEVYASSESTCD